MFYSGNNNNNNNNNNRFISYIQVLKYGLGL